LENSAVDKFKAATLRLGEIELEVKQAEVLPQLYGGAVMRAVIDAGNSYAKPTERALDLLRKAQIAVSDQERARGAQERDEKIRKLGLELEAIRIMLPELAAKASVELGSIARAYMGEKS